jgi:hypothetical protein
LLPLDAEYRDYRARLQEAIRTIALAEERTIADVVTDVAAVAVDTQHFRLLPATPSGTIPLIDVVDVARGITDLMYSAAHAATIDGPMLVQPKARPPQVHTFVRSVRLAAPRAGSFVFSAQVPVVVGSGSGSGSGETVPFNRRVVRRLHQAVAATHEAAVTALRYDATAPFADRARDGVSANLCQAIALVGRHQPFDLRFAWARAMPTRVDVANFSFDNRLIDVVRAAADELPHLVTQPEVVLTATVVRLDRSRRGEGRVTLRGRLERQSGFTPDVTLSATLPPDLYEVAVAAHRDVREVRVVGIRQGAELIHVTSFAILDNRS